MLGVGWRGGGSDSCLNNLSINSWACRVYEDEMIMIHTGVWSFLYHLLCCFLVLVLTILFCLVASLWNRWQAPPFAPLSLSLSISLSPSISLTCSLHGNHVCCHDHTDLRIPSLCYQVIKQSQNLFSLTPVTAKSHPSREPLAFWQGLVTLAKRLRWV